ncbi:uncharacterized protein LOC129589947 [Paramacrobiotus metropolitanus]|uniref:uncharacterized protein LOC129589947 n=1 Tax=Paramacrobiotus metropolitanus TaxID=2943436 RepID=UPI0024458FFC|nr:uncharacterized protein LOC129589947 [Paramacrobiotus metropolitanus]
MAKPWDFPFLFRLLQLLGLFPYPLSPANVNRKRNTTTSIPLIVWSVSLSFLPLSLSVSTFYAYVNSYIDNRALKTLEFFTLIRITFMLLLYLQAFLVMLTLNSNAPNVRKLYNALVVYGTTQSNGRSHFVLFIWSFGYIAAFAFIIYNNMFLTIMKNDPENATWTSRMGLFHTDSFQMPLYAVCAYVALSTALSASCEIIPQNILLAAVLNIRCTLLILTNDVDKLITQERPEAEKRADSVLDNVEREYRRLLMDMTKIDKAFSGFMLLMFVKNAIYAAALLGYFFTSLDAGQKSVTEIVDQSVVWAASSVSLVSACIQHHICISCHNQVDILRNALFNAGTHFLKGPQQHRFDELYTLCTSHDAVITIGGFLRVDRQLIPTLAGILLGYGILIYQTHDTKMDMQTLVSKLEFAVLASQLGHCLPTGNLSLDSITPA